MDPDARVCPYCGELPGPGVFCAACGRNLSGVEQLPTRRTWEGRAAADAPSAAESTTERSASGAGERAAEPSAGAAAPPGAAEPSATAAAGPPATAEGGVAAFLGAMHAAGDPGATKMRRAEPGFLGRAQHVRGWVVRGAGRGQPGLFLTVDGSLHRLDTVTRGVDFRGTLDIDVVGPAAAETVTAAELAAVLRANGIDYAVD